MRRHRAVGVAALVVAAVAVSAAAVIAGNGDTVTGDSDQFSTHTDEQRATNSKQWQPIPGFTPITIDAPQTLTISAQMTQGKARVRVYNTATNTAVFPGSVLFSSKAANSFSFGIANNCPGVHQIQWKRVGDVKAVAAKISDQQIYDAVACP